MNLGNVQLHGIDRRLYLRIHYCLQKNKADHCDNNSAHKAKRFEWALIGEAYSFDLRDYKQLCVPCHRKMDYKGGSAGNTNRRRAVVQIDGRRGKYYIHDSIWAAHKNTGILNTSIVNCLTGRSKSAGGFKWQYR